MAVQEPIKRENLIYLNFNVIVTFNTVIRGRFFLKVSKTFNTVKFNIN